jgi:hypothetical protein
MKRTAMSAKAVVFSFLVATITLSFQNCSPVQFSEGFQELGSQGNCASNPALCQTPVIGPRCTFNGQSYSEGQTVTGFLNSSVPTGQSCISEVRKCVNGSLTGSYPFALCQVNAPASCLFNGQTIPHGQSVDAFLNSSAAYGSSCASEKRTCNNGVLSGSYNYGSCSVGAAASCLFNGQTVAHGSVVRAFQASTVGYGQSCLTEDRLCSNGVLSGSYSFASCSAGSASSCLFDNQNVAHGQSVTAYASSSVPFGSACTAQTRTCNNGTMSGSYAYSTCTTSTASSCYFNGQTIPHGGSTYAYASSSVSYGSSCSGQSRTCNNGVLSGSYGASSCSVQSPVCPSSFYPGILCEVRAYCPDGRLASVNNTSDVMALTVSGYTGLSGTPGGLTPVYGYNVDFRLSDMSLISLTHRIRCSSSGVWVDDSGYPGGSGCVARKSLSAYDARCR